jgi:RNA polymerase primary sigma factor
VPDPWDPDAPRNAADTASDVRRLIAAHLGDRERSLLRQRFGLDGTAPQTYAELAVVTGTSRQNVQQLVERALRRLRTALSSDVTKA